MSFGDIFGFGSKNISVNLFSNNSNIVVSLYPLFFFFSSWFLFISSFLISSFWYSFWYLFLSSFFSLDFLLKSSVLYLEFSFSFLIKDKSILSSLIIDKKLIIQFLLYFLHYLNLMVLNKIMILYIFHLHIQFFKFFYSFIFHFFNSIYFFW